MNSTDTLQELAAKLFVTTDDLLQLADTSPVIDELVRGALHQEMQDLDQFLDDIQAQREGGR